MAKKHVFLSYLHENRDDVARLRRDLIAAGEAVWWDQDLLPGQNWDLIIRKAINECYAIVVCLSEELAGEKRSGVYKEIRRAIEKLQEYGPLESFIFPVRFSKCSPPDFKIDATTYLEDLQYIDLYPEVKRQNGLNRLITAVKNAPERPSKP